MCVVENILRKIHVLITAKHKNVDFKALQMLVIPMEARMVRVHTCVCVCWRRLGAECKTNFEETISM